MRALNIFAIVFLIVGLIVGAGIGSIAFPQTITETIHQTETSTISLTETVTQVSTVVSTEKSTTTLTTIERVTETATKTVSVTKTEVETVTVTSEITVYPTGGESLMSDKGSGDKNTKPFTLNETADLRIEVYLRGSPEYAGFHWYLIPVGAEKYQFIADGGVDEDVGSFEFYAYQVPPGSYYIHVISANVKWEISVYKLTAS